MRKLLCVIMGFSLLFLTACKPKVEVSEEALAGLTPETSAINAENIYKNTPDEPVDYEYWTYHKVGGTDRILWDMTSNTGEGCRLGSMVYYTQIVGVEEAGYELGYPLEELINTMVTEQNVLFTMTGLEIGKWGTTESGAKVRYNSFRAEPYVVHDKSGELWYFFLYTYTLADESTDFEDVQYFNILGVSEIYDDWLTLEITGSIDKNKQYLDEYKAILEEFAEIYGFDAVTDTSITADYLLGY